MKKIFFCLMLLLNASVAFANTPEQVVQQMMNDLKSSQDLATTLKYVHWPSAFNNMGPNERQSLGVQSPEQLKEVVQGFLRDPRKIFGEKMSSVLGEMDPQQRAQMQTMFDQQVAQMEAQRDQRLAEISRATFTVDKAVINGNKAKVKIIETGDGKTSENTVELVQIDGGWYISQSDMRAFQGSSAPGTGSAPLQGGAQKQPPVKQGGAGKSAPGMEF